MRGCRPSGSGPSGAPSSSPSCRRRRSSPSTRPCSRPPSPASSRRSAASRSSPGSSRSTCSRPPSPRPCSAASRTPTAAGPVLLLGIGVFLAGSVVCAVAPGMGVLDRRARRPGIGAGAVQPVSLTIVGDLYSVAERARVQGYLASVWGMSAVVGPAVGGLFSQYASWRWIFVDQPAGRRRRRLAARPRLSRDRDEDRPEHGRRGLTHARRRLVARAPRPARGRRRLGLGLARWGSASSPWARSAWWRSSSWSAGRASPSCRCGVPAPVLVGAALAQLGVGALLIGLDSYVPVFAQGVLGAPGRGRRLRARHDDHRLATRRDLLRSPLPADRLPRHLARGRRGPGGRVRCGDWRCWQTPASGRWRASASSPASGSASSRAPRWSPSSPPSGARSAGSSPARHVQPVPGQPVGVGGLGAVVTAVTARSPRAGARAAARAASGRCGRRRLTFAGRGAGRRGLRPGRPRDGDTRPLRRPRRRRARHRRRRAAHAEGPAEDADGVPADDAVEAAG